MKKVLEDLYFGEIQPNVSNYDGNSQLKTSAQVVNENEEILLKILGGEERKLFLDLVNAQSEIDGSSAVDNFINGFKLGARIVAESLMEM